MEFGKEIIIKGKTYFYVDTQRDGESFIYKNENTYLRIGEQKRILKDLIIHKKMESYGFPVAKLLEEGFVDDLAFFVEESLGEKCFSHIFKNEEEAFGKIQEKTFNMFVDVCAKFLKVQVKTLTSEKNWQEFEHGFNLDLIYEELPDCKLQIEKKWKQVRDNLNVFPFAIAHGDFTTHNIYPTGIIDLEDSFSAPFGYDIGAIVRMSEWFPESKDYEVFRLYNFSEQQMINFREVMDEICIKHNLPKISDYIDDFNFAKGVWFAVRMDRTPKLRQFRYNLLKKLI